MSERKDFEKMRALGALAGVTAALGVVAAAKAGEHGALLPSIQDAAEKGREDPGYLVGFCEEIERYIAGWVTDVNPITTPTPHKYEDIPLG